MDAIAKPTTRPDLVRVQDLEVTVIVSLRLQVHIQLIFALADF